MRVGTITTHAIAMLAFALIATPGVYAQDDSDGNLLKPVNDVDAWRLEQHEEAVAEFSSDREKAVFKVDKVTGTDWHVQAFQTELTLEEGKDYTLKARLGSDTDRTVMLNAGADEGDYHSIGLDEVISIGKEPEDFEVTFTATDVATGNNRVGIVMGQETGSVHVYSMTLTAE